MKPIRLHQIEIYYFTSTFVWEGSSKKEVDLDMQLVDMLIEHAVMQRNWNLGVLLKKIGVKTTMCYQHGHAQIIQDY